MPDEKDPDEKDLDEKDPVEQALELLVFAPLGLAITARNQLPEMVAKGRAQVEGQIGVARMLGQFAVQHGRAELERRLKAYIDPPLPPEAAPAEPEPEPEPEPEEPQASVAVPLTLVAQPAPDPPPPLAPEPAAAPPAADLAIPGYDALSASQVVQRLAGLSPAELEQVRASEAATRGRKTVLNKISQLQ
ncbi:MAG: hypothetical protein WKF86_09625 [Acidimicrobiales bacterium]